VRDLTSLTLSLWFAVGLAGCGLSQEGTSRSTQAVAGSDRLDAGEALSPGEAISSGSTTLVYQGDNNLVLYQGGTPIWATMAGLGIGPSSFAMQTDCNAVVYSVDGYVWASWTNGQGSSCSARVVEGDWFICSGNNRVFSARGGGDCGGGGGGGGGGDPLAVMARIGGDGDRVAAYLIHMFKNTEFNVNGTVRTLWDMTDQGKMLVSLGNNGAGTDSYRVIFHYTPEGHSMIAAAQWFGALRYRNTDTGAVTGWIGFTQGGIFDPTLAHPDMDHAFKSLFEESGKDLCLQPQWNDNSTVGEIDIDFHRQLEVIDHGRPDNSDPLTTCSGGCKNNNATYIAAWGTPPGLPGYSGPMTVIQGSRGPIHDFHEQRNMPGFPEVANVLGGRGIGVVTGNAIPR
jgi:hypothetical protein